MNTFTGLTTGQLIVSILSFLGGMIFVVSLVFQIIKIVRNKSAKDLSLAWSILTLISVITGVIYGVYFQLWSIYITSSLQTVLSFVILVLKIKYK